ncbi:molybdopterin cofactor biosynthetic protein [Neofusicoccum parvum]|uniref:Molybdopterin cofactor biosynthetic protein n=1 Tax=Neofusicoccum parvum TaxID=310453 RepID=A0ACB5RZ45_9PEZI|nr:molybdopterin cofactor biosynthetic protein [Neofusicoccum parvum]
MVSVGGKRPTRRTAIAVSSVRFSKPAVLKLIKANAIKKGDVLSVARIAGIMASKNTPSIIPLCHNINITHADVEAGLIEPPPEDWQKTEDPFLNEDDADELDDAHDFYNNNKDSSRLPVTYEPRTQMSGLSPGDPAAVTDASAFPHGGVMLTARVETYGPTGVEMDALTAANAAALTVFDMCKAVDRAMSLQNSRVVIKTGGVSGDWVDAGWLYARAGVARRKELEGVMAWTGDLPPGEKRGRRWWKKCFRVLVRAGWDRDRAAALLSWVRPATDAANGKGEGGGGGEEGGAAVVEEEGVDEVEEEEQAFLWEEGDEVVVEEEGVDEGNEERAFLGEGRDEVVVEEDGVDEGKEERALVGEGEGEVVEEEDREEWTPEESLRSEKTASPSKSTPPSTNLESGGYQEAVLTASMIREMSAQDIFADKGHGGKEEVDSEVKKDTAIKNVDRKQLKKEKAQQRQIEDERRKLFDLQRELEYQQRQFIVQEEQLTEEESRHQQKEVEDLERQVMDQKRTLIDLQLQRLKDKQILSPLLESQPAERKENKKTDGSTTAPSPPEENTTLQNDQSPSTPKAVVDPRKDRPFGTGYVPPSVEATPEEAEMAQKRPENPAYELLQGRQRRRSLARWERDAEWDKRMERLAALERLAQEAEASPKYSRHWGRAVSMGGRATRKLELAARIGVHDSAHDVLAWEPPGVDDDEAAEVGDEELQDSWSEWTAGRRAPAPTMERNVPRKYVERHAEADRKARLKRAMGRVDYNEFMLLSAIEAKRERRWESEEGLLEGDWVPMNGDGEERPAKRKRPPKRNGGMKAKAGWWCR